MINFFKIIIAGIALVLFSFVLVAWVKNTNPSHRDSKLSLGAGTESKLSNYGTAEGVVPQTVLPELARLENVTWSQDLQGRRVVDFQFVSLNTADVALKVYKNFLENSGWKVSLSGNTVLGIQEGRRISYTFNQIDNSVLVIGKYEEVLQ